MAASKPKTREDLELVEIDNEAVVYDPRSGGVRDLNLSAKLVFQLCDGRATVDETASEIANAFELPLETVEKDVRDGVRLLRDLGFLESDAAGEARSTGNARQDGRDVPVRLDPQPGPCTQEVDGLTWPVSQCLELGPYRLGLRTNSERVGAWLADTLSEYRSEESVRPLYSMLVADEPGRGRGKRIHVLYRGSFVLARTPDLSELVRTLRFELESFLFADWGEALLLEAAVVSSAGVSALVPSLTASELLREQRRVGRRGVSVPPGGRMAIDLESGLPVPVPPRLAALEDGLGELVGADRASLGSSAADVDRASEFDVVCLPASLAMAGMQPISSVLAVRMLAELVANLPRLGARALEGLARLIERVPCYRFSLTPALMLDALVTASGSSPADAAGEEQRPSSASRAAATGLPPFDKYALYSASVQSPERQMNRLEQFYRDERGAEPRVLREDFCGTFANSCAWVRLGSDRRAVGVDLDPEPLAWGCANLWARLNPSAQVRVRVIEDDVLEPGLPRADVIAALNFSYFVFKTRPELLAYFRNCLATLEPGGMLALDCFGGVETEQPGEEPIRRSWFTYFWEQEGFDPVTREAVFQMHFQRDGERKRRRVFTYDWRIWTVAELREALLEAGFAAVRTYWEGIDPDGRYNGEWYLADPADEDRARWWSYVLGLR